jgi:D-alanyl-D-alanine endopeptidase (penicillin-binding protein 7)
VLLLAAGAQLAPTVAHARKAKHRGGGRPVAIRAIRPDGMPNVQADSAIVVDLKTSQVLYAKNAETERPIASLTKLMVALVLTDRDLELDGKATLTEEDRNVSQGGARSRLMTGMEFSNGDLLHAMLMGSDNRAPTAMARTVGLDHKALVDAMNHKAKALGLIHTRFSDPVGLSEATVSTAKEFVKVLTASMKVPLLAEIERKAEMDIQALNRPGYVVRYLNTDRLIRGAKETILGGKTGYTDEARYCLAVAARLEDGREVAMVLLGAVGELTRFADFRRIVQWLGQKKP